MSIWTAEIKELEKLYESIKGHFPELEKELGHLIKTEDENVIMLYSRRCLEIIITDLCECELKRSRKTEPLKGIIDKLHKEEKVPSHIISSMYSLNELSTYGTHPKDFDPEQVKPVLNNLDIVIKWYLKYKDYQIIGKQKSGEEKYESKHPEVSVVEKSIAVLPFHNYSADSNQEYMSDGLTDEIINHLYKIKSFDRVVSLSSVLTYKKADKKIPQIADELKVNYILEGTYKKIGDQVKVTAQLIEPRNDKHIWQNEYNKPYKEIICIQADIALQIAGNIKVFITDSEKQNIQKIPTNNQEAYQLLQQGIFLLNTGIINTIDQLLNLGFDAIKLDPDYAEAYAFLGMLTLGKGSHLGGSEMQSVVWDAESYLDKALELDQNSFLAHLGLAFINEWVKWDYIRAEKEFLKAIELSPNNPSVIEGFTEFLAKRNRLEDALSYFKNAEILLYYTTRIQIIFGVLSGNKDEAINSINILINSKESFFQRYAGEYYLWLEDYDSAKLLLETAVQNKDHYMLIPRFQACLALAYHKTKDYLRAQMIINQLIDKSRETSAGSPEYFIGWYYSGIKEVDSSFYWLEKAFKKRSPEMPWLKIDPVFNNLKDDNRYWDLYKRTGHKAYDDYWTSLKELPIF
jgi:TolB-like protein